MSLYFADYDLHDGYIHNWLVAGPQATPVADLGQFAEHDPASEIIRRHYQEGSGVLESPVERAALTLGDTELTWQHVRCDDDHLLDLSDTYPTCHYLRSWAYTRVGSPIPREVTLILTSNGPADVWLNGEHVYRHERFCQLPQSVAFPAPFRTGHNRILVRLEQVAMRECPYAMALQVVDLPLDDASEAAPVLIPTSNADLMRRRTLERIFEAAYLERDVYAPEETIVLHWPEEMTAQAEVTARLQTRSGRIYAEANQVGRPGDRAWLQTPVQIPEGAYQVLLIPQPREYYEANMRVERRINLWSVRGHYSQRPYSTYQQRRLEALRDASQRKDDLFSEIAKMALGQWSGVRADTIGKCVERVNRREEGSNVDLIGLLGMLHRFGEHPSFPRTLKGRLEESVLNYRYWKDEPGSDAMCFCSEVAQILFHTCEILAGQLYPDQLFANAGETGRRHRENGERMALSWLRKRSRGGFREWDSGFESILAALAHLVDLADSPQVWEMAAVLMDKVFFSLALNSYRGVFGSTHGRAATSQIKGGRLDPTAGIGRLMWGMGVFNHHLAGTVSLACAGEYELPPIIREIAADTPDQLWNLECHAGKLEPWCDGAAGPWEVNKVTYKTPDGMLCSTQDYRPGERGSQEHIWQATLGPDAVVFVTHPACTSQSDAKQPNFWRGNAILPRVGQWRDVLVAVHRLPENDWLGFTHAYFPASAFDEHALREDAAGHRWALARVGEGYLALTAAGGLELITRGDSAYHELRSQGGHNVWLCHLGRASLDGRFGEFQDRILSIEPSFEALSVSFTSLRGDSLAFGWEGPPLVNGEERPTKGYKHYENPYCEVDWPASQMDIRFDDKVLRLEFSG
jgi:hypothetical protein